MFEFVEPKFTLGVFVDFHKRTKRPEYSRMDTKECMILVLRGLQSTRFYKIGKISNLFPVHPSKAFATSKPTEVRMHTFSHLYPLSLSHGRARHTSKMVGMEVYDVITRQGLRGSRSCTLGCARHTSQEWSGLRLSRLCPLTSTQEMRRCRSRSYCSRRCCRTLSRSWRGR